MNKLLKKAFTLIELLVVIAIIGILSGLIVVAMGGITNSANIAKGKVFSNSLRNALMMNLVSEWKFDGSGVADGGAATTAYTQDNWSGGNNLTINGDSPIVYSGSNCVYNSCLYFDGNSYLSVNENSSLDITNGITLEAWVNVTSLQNNNYEYIIRKYATDPNQGTLYGLSMGYGDATVKFFIWTQNYSGCQTFSSTGSAGALTLNQWYHVTATYDSVAGLIRIFINGALNNSTSSITGAIRTTSNPLYISHRQDGTLYFNGYMDNVRLYNAAIPTSMIQEQYYAGLNNLLSKGEITGEEYSQRLESFAFK